MKVIARLVVEIGGVKTVMEVQDTGVLSLVEQVPAAVARVTSAGPIRPPISAGPCLALGMPLAVATACDNAATITVEEP